MANNPNLPFTYRSPAPPQPGNRWIRLRQENTLAEALTLEDAAAAVDNVFGLAPCIDSSTEDTGQGTGDEDNTPERAAFDAAAAALLGDTLCAQADYWTAHVLVLCSHSTPTPTLRSETATIVSQELVVRWQRDEIDLSASTSADLQYPYADSLTTTAPTGITITVQGSTLYADRPCGRLVVRYRTRYTRATIRVPVTPDGRQRDDGTVERPDLEAAALIAFQGDLVTALTLTPPPQDESEDQAQIDYYCAGGSTGTAHIGGDCWRIRRSRYLCNCSKSEVGDPVETRVAVPCPKGVSGGAFLGAEDVVAGYVTCPDEEDEVNDPEYYEKTCCEPPPGPLPRCKKTYSLYRGGAEIEGGAAGWRNIYGANVQLTAVSPEGGVCGEEVREWDTSSKNCCDDIIPLSPHPDNPTEFHPGESHWVEVLDGKPGELIWTAQGGLYFRSNGRKVHTLRTPSRRVLVYAESEGTCPEPSIKVDDRCKPIEMTFVGGAANPLDLPYDDLVIAPEERFVLQASGGVPPMRWQVGGKIKLISWDQETGRSALFEASEDFCGTETIEVVDVCGDSASAVVRSTEGRWEAVTDFDPCVSPFGGSMPATQMGNIYRVEARGYRADIGVLSRMKNFNRGGTQGWPHLGSCDEAVQGIAEPCGYTGVQMITVPGYTPPDCTPEDYQSGGIYTERHCYGMCYNYYIYVKFQDGTGYEYMNRWAAHVHVVSALRKWVCPDGSSTQ